MEDMEHIEVQEDKVYIAICRSVTKDICMYINGFRVYGAKPNTIGNNLLKSFYIDRKDLEKALKNKL
jgi:hypothetical protein